MSSLGNNSWCQLLSLYTDENLSDPREAIVDGSLREESKPDVNRDKDKSFGTKYQVATTPDLPSNDQSPPGKS